MNTNHSIEIGLMRQAAEQVSSESTEALLLRAAADILEAHDATGISLDEWTDVRIFVEDQMYLAADLTGHPSARTYVEPNRA